MKIENLNIKKITTLDCPKVLKSNSPVSELLAGEIKKHRQTIYNILEGKDKRLIAIVGPCSIHDSELAIEYAKKLKELAKAVEDKIFIVMRVYFEKPRTTVGWKGLISDPDLNNTHQMQKGLNMARHILLKITEIGLPIATEFLDPVVPQYTADLISWVAIGARTTESQTHREMASGLSMPVGFKNSTDGSITNALNAIESSSNPQSFLGINQEGLVSVVCTSGNPNVHAVLRGGSNGPNFESEHIKKAEKEAIAKGIKPNFIIDCSHANSNKDHSKQPIVLKNIINQVINGNECIKGFMLESNLYEGNQPLNNPQELRYGVSITDKCLNWETTEESLLITKKMLS